MVFIVKDVPEAHLCLWLVSHLNILVKSAIVTRLRQGEVENIERLCLDLIVIGNIGRIYRDRGRAPRAPIVTTAGPVLPG